MEFFQELTFTAFLALLLSLVVAKIVALAGTNSRDDGNASVCSLNEGAVAKEVILSKGLRVDSVKSKKRVKFVDDVVIRRVDPHETEKGSETLEIMDDVKSVVLGEGVAEKSVEGIDQFVNNGLSEDCGVNSFKEDEGSENIELLTEKYCEGDEMDEVFGLEEETLVMEGLNSRIAENPKNEVILEGDDMIIDKKEGNGELGSGQGEGLTRGNVDEEEKLRSDRGDDVNAEGKMSDCLGDDDWEGIERSELEKVFAEAVNYLEFGVKRKEKGGNQLAELGSDLQMQLYGLHKIAVEGPCHEPQPMALKVAARAKWNAWQRLGGMSKEEAMEQYIKILSDSIPGWIHHHSADDNIQVSPQIETAGNAGSHSRSVMEDNRELDVSGSETGDSSTASSSVEKGSTV